MQNVYDIVAKELKKLVQSRKNKQIKKAKKKTSVYYNDILKFCQYDKLKKKKSYFICISITTAGGKRI